MTNALNTVTSSSMRLRMVKSRIDNIFLIFLNISRVNYARRHAGKYGFLGGVSILAARKGCKPRRGKAWCAKFRFFVLPPCSLCLRGEYLLNVYHHRGTEDTEVAQRLSTK